MELRSQPGAQPVAKREENSAKCWSEWQDLNLRPRMVKILIGYVLIVIHYHNRLGPLFSCYQGASRAGMRGTDTSFSRTSRAASLSGLYNKHRSSLNATGEP